MSEFSMSRKSGLPSFLLSDFFHLCVFILSHPLYFSYFIFFSPYLYKIFSFLSPLFITTTLLLLAFLSTVSTSIVQDDSHHGSLAAMYLTVSERLRCEANKNYEDDEYEDFRRFEEFEVYKIVFETSAFDIREDPFEALEEVVKETCSEVSETLVEKCLILENDNNNNNADKDSEEKPQPVENSDYKIIEFEKPMVGPVETLKWCLEEERELENLSRKKQDKETAQVKPWDTNYEKVDEQDHKQEALSRNGSKASTGIKGRGSSHEYFASPDHDFCRQYSWKSDLDDCETVENSSLGSFGSMRKEKEWRRTLACKLFEERHNGEGGEGMDLLWETYEASDSNNVIKTPSSQSRSSSKKGKTKSFKSVVEYSTDADDDEYEDEAEGQLCCLQALKFSAGKMNLGMGRPNLLKISKALKGIGWITHVGRHGKKRYH